MAKLTDAQTATLQRGAIHLNGFISPAAKTPEHMARLQAQKLAAMGLVQEAPCAFDEPTYFRDEEGGATLGYRVTAAGFEALGIDGSEWPAYATQDPDADAGLAGEVLLPAGGPDMPAAWQAPAEDDATLDANEHGRLAADYQAEQAGELAAEDAADAARGAQVLADIDSGAVSLVTGAALDAVLATAAVLPGKRTLVPAVAAFLAAWDREDGASVIAEAIEAMRAAMPAAKVAKAAKPAGEPGVPREGSKLALVIDLLSRPGGAIAAEVEAATGWNNTSTRGFISSLKIKRGLAVASAKEAGTTRYWIGAENAPALPEAAPAKVAKEAEAAF